MKLLNQKLFIIIIKHFTLDFLKYFEYLQSYKLHKIFKTILQRLNILTNIKISRNTNIIIIKIQLLESY